MKRRIFVASAAAGLAASAFTPKRSFAAAPAMVILFAPANSDKVLTEIGKAFESTHPGTTVRPFFGQMQVIYTQLESGAPCDVFVASVKELADQAVAKNLVVGAFQPLAKLVGAAVVPKNNPAGIKTFADFARKGVRLSVGNDEAPVGHLTKALLKKASVLPAYGPDFVKNFEANETPQENTKLIVSQLTTGSADAGIVFASDVTGPNADRLTEVPLPPELDSSIENVVAIAKSSLNPALAKQFMDFLESADAKAIFRSHRYG
jgi:molybdate transport system substrate-binding protein